MPNTNFPAPGGAYTVTLHGGENSTGTLTLTVNNGVLNSDATWDHNGSSRNVTVSWDGTHLKWDGPHHRFLNGTWNGTQFSGNFDGQITHTNGNWTAVKTG